MNTSQDRQSIANADEQAAWYVARLYSGEMTAGDEERLFAWLDARRYHRQAYEEALALWEGASALSADPQMQRAVESSGPSKRNWRLPLSLAAAALVAAFSVAFLLTVQAPDVPELVSFETQIGEQSRTVLPDQTMVHLNTGSRILVDYTPSVRRIILDYGEIYLDVQKDGRPLIVTAGGRDVIVVGTRFSVSMAGHALKVAVEEGEVAVTEQDARFPLSDATPAVSTVSGSQEASHEVAVEKADGVRLRAGAIGVFDEGRPADIAEDDIALNRAMRWRSGMMRFDDEPLLSVVAELNRYSRAKILIEDKGIMALEVGGVFKIDEPVDLYLEGLEEVFPIRVIRYPDRYVLVSVSDSAE